jgi:hypothetical protein
LIAVFTPNAPMFVADARSHCPRRFSSNAAPASAMPCHSSPCSPSFENAWTARSAPGLCPAVRNAM